MIFTETEAGVTAVFESDAYKAYLKCMSKFHNYSLNNTLLIALQRPDASLVCGYQAWKKDHGRRVRKGEKGIKIRYEYIRLIRMGFRRQLTENNWLLKSWRLKSILGV